MRMEELRDELGFEKGELGIEIEEPGSTKLNELKGIDLPIMKIGNVVVEVLLSNGSALEKYRWWRIHNRQKQLQKDERNIELKWRIE
ncbi:hypothetical protein V6N12_035992 [Hibiscus sabdariffa]|uniref:Uncharacterized protein n=1 Tax=Hibiscus sabdariffa TaxID=183260 RepID=A0ABR2EPQ8_9ROSI